MRNAGTDVFCLIPARGGSKRFPRKNVALLGGKPLIAWTIDAARASGVFDDVWVSSDDVEIRDVAQAFGAKVLSRPAELANDRATVAQVARETIAEFARYGPDCSAVYVLLPTSPFRSGMSIAAAWRTFSCSNADALMSVSPMAHPPEWALAIEGGMATPMNSAGYEQPRANLAQSYRADGGHSIVRTQHLLETGQLIGPTTLAFPTPVGEAVDIDEPSDLEWAEFCLSRREGVRV